MEGYQDCKIESSITQLSFDRTYSDLTGRSGDDATGSSVNGKLVDAVHEQS